MSPYAATRSSSYLVSNLERQWPTIRYGEALLTYRKYYKRKVKKILFTWVMCLRDLASWVAKRSAACGYCPLGRFANVSCQPIIHCSIWRNIYSRITPAFSEETFILIFNLTSATLHNILKSNVSLRQQTKFSLSQKTDSSHLCEVHKSEKSLKHMCTPANSLNWIFTGLNLLFSSTRIHSLIRCKVYCTTSLAQRLHFICTTFQRGFMTKIQVHIRKWKKVNSTTLSTVSSRAYTLVFHQGVFIWWCLKSFKWFQHNISSCWMKTDTTENGARRHAWLMAFTFPGALVVKK